MQPNMAEQVIADRKGQALADVAGNSPRRARPQCRPWWRGRLGVGTTVLVAATLAFAGGRDESGSDPSSARLRNEAGTLVGLRATESERVFYEPGGSRSWSPGPQIIGVKVISGRVTVYGVDGERRVYIAGEGYAAGWAPHRAVNETDEPVETLVTHHARP